MSKQAEVILALVIGELMDRDLLDRGTFEQTFGGESFDEIAGLIRNEIKE